MMIITTFVLIISIMMYEFSGVTITKKVSSTFRVVIEIVKVLFVWVFELIYEDYIQKDLFKEKNFYQVLIVEFFGYVLVILGNLIINEIIKLKFCKMDRFYGKFLIPRKIP